VIRREHEGAHLQGPGEAGVGIAAEDAADVELRGRRRRRGERDERGDGEPDADDRAAEELRACEVIAGRSERVEAVAK
jgi:hypothetical protein